MYGTRSAEDGGWGVGGGRLQGELRSQEVLPAAAVKYMERSV